MGGLWHCFTHIMDDGRWVFATWQVICRKLGQPGKKFRVIQVTLWQTGGRCQKPWLVYMAQENSIKDSQASRTSPHMLSGYAMHGPISQQHLSAANQWRHHEQFMAPLAGLAASHPELRMLVLSLCRFVWIWEFRCFSVDGFDGCLWGWTTSVLFVLHSGSCSCGGFLKLGYP